MKTSLNFICPKCKAAKGAKCTEPKRDGSRFIPVPHIERIKLAEKEEHENFKNHGFPQASLNFFRNYFKV